jgi:hypothetical protein
VIGLLSGVVAAIAIVVVGDTYGAPGSADYRIYETFNRVMAILLALEACSLLAFRVKHVGEMGKMDRFLIAIALIAWIGAAVGTGAEFWLYSDLPYGVDNLRSAAFSLFSLNALIVGLALFVLGLRILIGRKLPNYFGIVLILYLPVDIALFVAGQSIFLASALTSIALAILTLISGPVFDVENLDSA